MALTPEQLAAAKAKLLQTPPATEASSALSETAAQAKARLLATTPQQSVAPTAPAEQEQPEEQDGFFKSLIKEPAKIPMRIGVRLGELGAAAGLFGKDVKRGAEMNQQKATEIPFGPLGNIKVEPVKTGVAGVKQAVGETLETASYGVGAGGAGQVAKQGAKGIIRQGIKQGVKEGVKGGALYGAGEGFQKDKDVAGIAGEAALGASVGGVFGGTIGGAAAAVGKAANRLGSSVVDRAEATMRDVAGMSKKQAQNEAKGILKSRKTGQEQPDDFRTLAEEGVFWKDKNEGGALKHDTVDAQEELTKRIDETEEIYQRGLQDANPNVRHDLEMLKRDAIQGAQSNSAQTTKELRQKISDAVDAEIELNGRYVNNETFNKIKRGMYERGRYETMAEAGAAYRRTGEAIARMIEVANEGKLNVKEVNQRLGKLIRARDFLAKLHGGVVRGGGLSRKFAGLAGAMAGRSTNIPIIGELLGYKIGEYAQMSSVSPARRFSKFLGKMPFGKSERAKVLGKTAEDVAAAEAERARTPRLGPGKTIFGQAPKPKPDTSRILTQEEIRAKMAQESRPTVAASKVQQKMFGKKIPAARFAKEDTAVFKGRGSGQLYEYAPNGTVRRLSGQEANEYRKAGYEVFENSKQAKEHLEKGGRGKVIEGEIVQKKPEPKTYGFNIDAEDARVRSINRGGALPKVKPVSETLAETVQKIKKGEEFGITLNHNGTVYNGKGAVVTLHSKNFTHEEATPRAISDFLNQMRVAYQDHPNVKFGTFKMDDGHVSVDINMVTRDRGLAKRIATENNQKSYWDYELNNGEGGEVVTGGNGESKFTRGQISDALELAKESGFGATPTETPQRPKAPSAVSGGKKLTLYRGADKKVETIEREYKRIKSVKGNQRTLLQELADAGDKDVKEFLENSGDKAFADFFVPADKLIREKMKGKYDLIEYDHKSNPIHKGRGSENVANEYHDMSDGKFYSDKKTLAEIYAMNSRSAKYSPLGKTNPRNPHISKISEAYMADRGVVEPRVRLLDTIDEGRAKRIADAFDDMKDEPNNPKVRKAYEDLAKETKDQYDALTKAGYKMEPWEGKGQPYKNSAEMVEDVRNNKHLWFFKTDEGFGTGADADHPLLKESGIVVNGHKMKYNDLFRAVHDMFGHAKEGNQFGPVGEENAWRIHSVMYSPDARRAMTSETRGQNSWVNFGKSRRNKTGGIIKKGEEGFIEAKDRPYAEQKTGLLPDEFVFQKGEKSTPFGKGKSVPIFQDVRDIYKKTGKNTIPVDKLRTSEEVLDMDRVDDIVRQIEENGTGGLGTIRVAKNGVIIDGHHRAAAMMKYGIKKIPVMVIDEKSTFKYEGKPIRWLSESDKKIPAPTLRELVKRQKDK